jgi:peptide-methionine (S)-S-oxide reductase
MSIVFYHNDDQRRLAMAAKQSQEARLGHKVVTQIIPFSRFYPAEDYHQKYYLQLVPDLMKEFAVIYPYFGDFVDSTAAARINGYLGGHGTFEALQQQLSSFGLSPAANERMLRLGRRL